MAVDRDVLKGVYRFMFSGNSIFSIILYILIFYFAFVYLVIPAVYAYTPISYISAVVSGSMEHNFPQIQYTYYDWLSQHGIKNASSFPFSGGISIGSLAIAYKVPASQLEVGDVIIYHIDYKGLDEDIIHRIINVTEINGSYYYTTKGDANPYSLPFEINVPYSHVVGEVQTVIPYLGYPKYIAYVLSSYI